jgi:Gpi18-like mannosyltransferase
MLPLYPFCVHALAVIARNYLISAFVVSGVAAAVAAVLLYKLTRLDNSRATALKAVWLMLIFPSSFFLHIAYAESLFLALAIGCLYAARSDRWMVSGITGALAAMTRINGLILILALATEAIQQFISSRKWRSQWLWALAPLGGFAAYLFANYTTTGMHWHFSAFSTKTGISRLIGHGGLFMAPST